MDLPLAWRCRRRIIYHSSTSLTPRWTGTGAGIPAVAATAVPVTRRTGASIASTGAGIPAVARTAAVAVLAGFVRGAGIPSTVETVLTTGTGAGIPAVAGTAAVAVLAGVVGVAGIPSAVEMAAETGAGIPAAARTAAAAPRSVRKGGARTGSISLATYLAKATRKEKQLGQTSTRPKHSL